MDTDRHGFKGVGQRGVAICPPPSPQPRVQIIVSRSPSPLPSPSGRGDSSCAALSFRVSVCLSLLTGCAKRGADERNDSLIAQHAGEQFSLSLEERAGVRASVGLTFPCIARRELEKKSGRKVVTNENCLALTQAAKEAKRMK